MSPDTPLIDFFRRVYAPLKLAGHRSKVEAVETAIEALTASQGREATIGDLVRPNVASGALVSLRDYLVSLGVVAIDHEPAFQAVHYRGKVILVPRGDPTPQEIQERAAAIRAGWSEGEMRTRIGLDRGGQTTWLPPGCTNHASDS